MTLKVGDKVRLTKDVGSFSEGDVFTVRGKGGYFDWHVGDERGCGYALNNGEFEKVEPEPKFKVGDRVRSLLNRGVEVIVTVTDPQHVTATWQQRFVRARFDNGTYGLWKESELEKIEEEPPRPLGLSAGDKVVNLKTGREGHVLKGPISGELKVYDTKPPIKDAVPAAALEEYEHWHPGTYDVWRRVTAKPKAQPW